MRGSFRFISFHAYVFIHIYYIRLCTRGGGQRLFRVFLSIYFVHFENGWAIVKMMIVESRSIDGAGVGGREMNKERGGNSI